MKRYLKYLILLLALTVLSGCSFRAQEGPELSDTVTPLTQEEIDVANEAFATTVEDADTGEIRTSEVSCFFTCYYDKPEKISLSSFLKYFPNGSILENSDEAEFAKLRELPGFLFNNGENTSTVETLPVPVHKYPKQAVSEVPLKYANITADDIINTDDVLYLEEYDAYYNFTSDFGPGIFVCVGGEKAGDIIRLWSAPKDNDGSRDVLTIREADGGYFIQAYQELKELQ